MSAAERHGMTAARRWRPPDKDGPGQRPRKAPPGPKPKLPSHSAETISDPGHERQTAPGAFAVAAVELWQRGLFPIPVGGADGKTPQVRGFTKMRRPSLAAVENWARRRPDAGIGIVTGRGVLVVDVDSIDRATIRAVEQRFGETPLKTLTSSGGAHLFFRYAGERSRNLRPELPVDIKARGGFVVVPPSRRPTGEHAGKAYTFLSGSWADLARLPTIKPDALPPRSATYRATRQVAADRPALRVAQLGAVGVGFRDDTLFLSAMRRASSCSSEQQLLAAGIEINAHFNPPLELPEVTDTINSVWWRYEVPGKNWVGRRDRAAAAAFQNAALAGHPDAETLLPVLRLAHGGRDKRGESFAASPVALAKHRVIPEWGANRRRYSRTLAALVEFGFLDIVHKGGRRPGDARKFRFHKGGLPMRPRLVVSNPSPAADADLMRVVDALKTLSIRKAGEALGMDRSKILRLKRRAEALDLIGVSHAETATPETAPKVSHPEVSHPGEASHCLTDEVSHSAGPNERKDIHPPRRRPARR